MSREENVCFYFTIGTLKKNYSRNANYKLHILPFPVLIFFIMKINKKKFKKAKAKH